MTCGTLQGYRNHRAFGTTPCQPCRTVYERLYGADEPRADGRPVPAFDAVKEARVEREKRARRFATKIEHGTYQGYRAHLRNHTRPCLACRDGYAAYMLTIRTTQKGPRQ